jgi:hypothetical protein
MPTFAGCNTHTRSSAIHQRRTEKCHVTAADSTKQVGTITFAYHGVTIGGAPALERAETWQFGANATVDTVVLFRRTLAPIRKHAWTHGATSDRTNDGRRVPRRPGWGHVRDS